VCVSVCVCVCVCECFVIDFVFSHRYPDFRFDRRGNVWLIVNRLTFVRLMSVERELSPVFMFQIMHQACSRCVARF
jgi:hypothetical protein